MPRPQYRRFGFVDFDAMGSLPSSEDADEFVCRRGNGDNVHVTRADIIAGAGSVPDPLLLNDGAVGAPTYSFTNEPTTGLFLDGGGSIDFAIVGQHSMIMDDTGLFSGQVANSGYLVSDAAPSATVPVHTFAGDQDTGLGTAGLDILSLIAGGVEIMRLVEAPGVTATTLLGKFSITGGDLEITGSNRPRILDIGSSATVPTLIPLGGDLNTGVGGAGADQLSLIAGGVEIARATEAVVDANQFIIAPGVVQNVAVTPSLALGDGDTGFYESVDDVLTVAIGGFPSFEFSGNVFSGENIGTGAILNEIPTATNPTLVPDKGDLDTGIGADPGGNKLSLIAGGIEGIRVTENSPFINITIAGQTTVTGIIRVDNAAGPAMLNEAASATNPTLIPNRAEVTTGIGSIAGIDHLDLIAGGLRCMAVSKVGASAAIGFYDGSPIALQTGVSVTTSAIHAALVALRLITA